MKINKKKSNSKAAVLISRFLIIFDLSLLILIELIIVVFELVYLVP